MRLKFLALASVLALACSGSISTARARPRQAQASKTWAVIIGVSKYPKLPGGQQLQFADSDATAFAESLKKAGVSPSSIRLLVGPEATIASIKSAIGNWLARSASEQDTVYIFFSGHGLAERDFGEAYLLAYDSDAANPYGTALSVSDLKGALAGRLRARRVLVIADPIRRDLFSGDDERAAGTALFASEFNKLVSARDGISAILGSGPGEFAREGRAWGGQGVFTKFLTEALTGSGDSNQDSLISATETFDYVSAKVAQETSNKQHPWRAGTLASDLVIARASGTPAAPQASQPQARVAEVEKRPDVPRAARSPAPEKIAQTAQASPAREKMPAAAGKPKPLASQPAPEKPVKAEAPRAEPKTPSAPSQTAASDPAPSKAASQPEQNTKDLLAKTEPINPEPSRPEAARMEPAGPPPAPPKAAPAPPVTSTVTPATVKSRVEPVAAGLPKVEAAAAPSPLSLQVEAAISSNRLIEPRGGSAWELYQKLAQEQPASAEAGRLRPMLAAALDRSGRAIVGGDLRADNVSEKVDDFRRAGQMFSRARALAPTDSTIADLEKLSAAQALLALQFFDEAERSLSQIQGERSASIENTLGLVYAGKLDSFRAERAFKRAAGLKPDWATPLYNLAMVYRQEKNEEALGTLERAASLEPQNAAILYALGDEYFGKERWQQAIDMFRRAVAIRPGDDALHTKLGHALYSLGHRDEANREYQKAQEIRSRKQ